MKGRAYSDGLHQAIQAKEGVNNSMKKQKHLQLLHSKIYSECIKNYLV